LDTAYRDSEFGHFDLFPFNMRFKSEVKSIPLTRDNRVVLIDYGLAGMKIHGQIVGALVYKRHVRDAITHNLRLLLASWITLIPQQWLDKWTEVDPKSAEQFRKVYVRVFQGDTTNGGLLRHGKWLMSLFRTDSDSSLDSRDDSQTKDPFDMSTLSNLGEAYLWSQFEHNQWVMATKERVMKQGNPHMNDGDPGVVAAYSDLLEMPFFRSIAIK
jgi:hypothetical protein